MWKRVLWGRILKGGGIGKFQEFENCSKGWGEDLGVGVV